MTTKVVAIGASAGGIEALEQLVGGFEPGLDACVLVTVHVMATARSVLPQILARAGKLPAEHARDGQPLKPGMILVAPPDQHLLVERDHVRLSSGPKVNRHRPSVDVMFTSAARWTGPGLVVVVLSGALDDGAVGAALAETAGAQVLTQDPADARFPSMPRAALEAAPGAVAVPLDGLAKRIVSAVQDSPDFHVHQWPAEHRGAEMSAMAESGDPQYLAGDETRLTRLVCPDCGGSLAEVDLPTVTYYRCHVGHQWSPQSLAAAQDESVENKLWAAIAGLEEQAALSRHLAGTEPAATSGQAPGYARRAERAAELLVALKRHLVEPGAPREAS